MRRKRKPYFRHLNCGVYPYDILFTIGTTKEEVEKYIIEKCDYQLDEEEKVEIRFSGGGRFVRLKSGAMVLWVRTNTVDIIAHEVFHATCSIMDSIGASLTDSSEESYAYLTEYIWKQILKK